MNSEPTTHSELSTAVSAPAGHEVNSEVSKAMMRPRKGPVLVDVNAAVGATVRSGTRVVRPCRVTTADLPCRREDPELWFAEAPAELERAKALCVECPVREQCLAGALERSEPWGVWGGEIVERGSVIARKRPRGRPRKTEVAA